jgi:hypothetical protein
MRRCSLAIALTFIVSLIAGTTAAQAVVVDINASGPMPSSPTPYNPSDQSGYYGVRPVPGTPDSDFANAGIATVASSGACLDPALPPDMVLQPNGLCWHGGPVIHKNETFAFVWDPNPDKNFAAGYEEQFLRDVADGSGTFTSPYAETAQYMDGGARAANASLYGGGFDDSTGYPPGACAKSDPAAAYRYSNDACVTDSQIRSELQSLVASNGIVGRIKPGYSPLLVVLMPPGAETCIDATAHLCSANSDPILIPGSPPVMRARFCSYHSEFVGPGGITFPYVVQPWTATFDDGGGIGYECDEPDVTKLPPAPTSAELAQDLGQRLVSPLSEAHIASIINPNLNGWFASDGSESSDNGCTPADHKVDSSTVGNSGQNPYFLQRDFNNGGAIVHDAFALPCVGGVTLNPLFVVPSSVNQGDVVQFDGEATQTTLIVPRPNFTWDFGDGTTAVGPSQTHVYTKGGTYTVKLTVTDRGGDTATLSQSIVVLDKNGQVVVPGGSGSGGGGGGGGVSKTPLHVRMQLTPQALKTMLRSGISIVVTANQPADAIVTLSITRSAAKRAHIRTGRGPSVMIGRGTASRIKAGSGTLHLKLSSSTVKKLRRLRHVTVTVRLALVAAGNSRTAVVAAARY